MEASDLYDTFFIDNEKEFSFVGCPDAATADRLKDLITNAIQYLEEKNAGKYIIQNDIDLEMALHLPNAWPNTTEFIKNRSNGSGTGWNDELKKDTGKQAGLIP